METDGIVAPREALEQSIAIMINQLKAVVGFREDDVPERLTGENEGDNLDNGGEEAPDEQKTDALKTRIDDLELSPRTMKSLVAASIRTVGGLARKKESDLLEISGLGEKGVQEIKRALSNFGIVLKD